MLRRLRGDRTGAVLGGRAFYLFSVGLVSLVLTVLVGLGYVWWTRSAGGAVVHYSWPVKWAITLAAESPDLPHGARFSTARMSDTPGPGRWTIRGQIELPNPDGPRLLTSYAATVSSTCPSLSKRQCWTLDGLVLGSVPAATAPAPHASRMDPAVSAPVELAAADSATLSDAEAVLLEEAVLLDEDLAYVLAERITSPTEDLFAVLNWPRASAAPPQRSHANAELVRKIQSALSRLGYDPGPVDGIAGKKTMAAVDAFRAERGVGGSGLTPELLDQITSRARSASMEATASQSGLGLPEELMPGPHQSDACHSFRQKNRECDL